MVAHGKSAGSLANFEVLAKLLAKSQAMPSLPRYLAPSSCPQNAFLSDALPSADCLDSLLLTSHFPKMPQESRLYSGRTPKCQRMSCGFWTCTEGKIETHRAAEQRSWEAVHREMFNWGAQWSRGRLWSKYYKKQFLHSYEAIIAPNC